jgi:hypothetical protein
MCGQPIPVNTPDTSVHCDHCQGDAALPVDVWRAVLRDFDENHGAMGVDKSALKTAEVGGWIVHFTQRRAAPACEKCSAPYPDDRVRSHGDTDFFCVACGDPGSSHSSPAWLSAQVRTASQIILTDPSARRGGGNASPVAVQDAPRPVLTQCPGCGGPLSITPASPRTVRCDHCHADVYLPDDLWRRLHPAKTMREWYVRFEGVTDKQREAEARRAAKAVDDAALARYHAQQREANAQREAEARAHEEADARAHDEAVRRAKVGAYLALLPLGALIALTVVMFLACGALEVELDVAVFYVIGGLQLAAAGLAAYATAKPIKLALRADGDEMIAYHWIWVIFSLFVFPFGPIILFVGLKRFLGTFAAARMSGLSGSRYIDAAKLSKRETWPAALFFLAMSLGVAGEIAAGADYAQAPPTQPQEKPARRAR